MRLPDAYVDVAPGAVSGVAVLDIDPRHGGDGSRRDLAVRRMLLPEAVEASTEGMGGTSTSSRRPAAHRRASAWRRVSISSQSG
jgi:hypothetical protein